MTLAHLLIVSLWPPGKEVFTLIWSISFWWSSIHSTSRILPSIHNIPNWFFYSTFSVLVCLPLPTTLQMGHTSRGSLEEKRDNHQSIPDPKRFTKLQLSILKARFSKCALVNEQERIDLGKEIGLSPNQVMWWFARQRTNRKRAEKRDTTSKTGTFTKFQLAILNKEFSKCPRISHGKKVELAKITGLTETQIQNWFRRQNCINPVLKTQPSHPFPINLTPIRTPLIPMPFMPMMFPIPSLPIPFIGGLNNRNSAMQVMGNGKVNWKYSVSPKLNESESEEPSTEVQEDEEVDIIN
ncbi:hypothetical protein CRE_04386 [Caenorhabditis remanei]|uniref:Homeobox domain-containing protein n=1 Tax=Caenorhabditis remanei TaxID=31234 RepID=E3NK40_CAERE|nr:hypothetical protein CRE_04386 [Caenorhabditis remanei]